MEEETLSGYKSSQFFPVHIGQSIKSPTSTYNVIGKLGYGRNSTVWLCRTLKDQSFWTVKVGTLHSGRHDQEAEIYKYLGGIGSLHPGRETIRTHHDAFGIDGHEGYHHCHVHTPLGMNLLEFQNTFDEKKLPLDLLKGLISVLLQSLDFLHSEAGIIHTDIQSKNILISLTDKTPLLNFAEAERINPASRKVVDSHRTIYSSRALEFSMGDPILCDFGLAVIGDKHKGVIQPLLFRAPEVILQMQWSSKADIWNLGALIWDLFLNQYLFDADTEQQVLCKMVECLGPSPLELLDQSEVSWKYFHENGSWKGDVVPPSSLESKVEGEEKDLFLDFLRSMLTWTPNDRKSAAELLEHQWLPI